MRPFVAALLVAAAGCTHHRPLAQVSELGVGEDVTVDVTGYGEVEVTTVATAGGTSFRDAGGTLISPDNVARVVDVRRARGAGEGFLIAGGLGVAVGVVLGFADGDDPPCADTAWLCFRFSAGEKATLGGIAFGSLGGLIGLVVGAVRGSQFVYDNGEGVTVTATAPSGSAAGLTVTF